MEQKAGYCEFLELVCSRVSTALEEKSLDGQIRLGKIVKNNGVVLDTLDLKPGKVRASPVIQMQELYRNYTLGTGIESIVEQICETLEYYHGKEGLIDPDRILDYRLIRDHIWMKAVNWELNAEQLSDRPHLRRLDLALSFYIHLRTAEGSVCSCEVTRALADVWQVDAEVLYQKALENINRDWEILLQPIDDVLGISDLDIVCSSDKGESAGGQTVRVYILSNREAFSGAVLMFISDKIRKLAQQEEKDLFILPSSIHEVLVLADQLEMSASGLKEIVMSVNRNTVEAQEFLSDHVYRYIRSEDRIVIEV